MSRIAPAREALLIIAHRGASATAPESTAAALRAAVQAGAAMIEVDIQMTAEGRLVVFHDEELERTTDGQGRLSRARYATLRRLDAGRWFHPRFAGQRILLLSQALALAPRTVSFNLELKRTPRGAALIAGLQRVLSRMHASSRVLISSFDARLVAEARALGAPRALICRRQPARSLAQARRLGCASWHPQASLVTPRRVQQAHAAGLRVYAWTVDEPRQAESLRRCGVDGFFTNDPARLLAWQRHGRAA